MKLVAKQTIGVPGRHLAPGTEFDTTEHKISPKEAQALIDSGAAERKMRQVADDEEEAPRGPASGATEAPDPDEIAARADTAAADSDRGRAGGRMSRRP
jgi:hypothetical protein